MLTACASGGGLERTKRYGVTWVETTDALNRGEGTAALAFYQREAVRLERQAQMIDASRAYAATAYIGFRLGSPQATIDAGLRVLSLLEQERIRPEDFGSDFPHIYASLGNAYGVARDRDAQVRYYREGALAGGITRIWAARFKRMLARASGQQGNHPLALEQGREALEQFRQLFQTQPQSRRLTMDLVVTLHVIAFSQRQVGDFRGAEASYREALSNARWLGDIYSQAVSLEGLGWVALGSGSYSKSAARFTEAMALADKLGLTETLAWSLAGAGVAYSRQGVPEEALTRLSRAADLLENVRGSLQELSLRSFFAEGMQVVYAEAIDSALTLGRRDEAFQFSERARARAFLDLLGTRIGLSKGRTQALLQEEMAIRERLSKAQATVYVLEAGDVSPRLESEIDAAAAAYRQFLDRVRAEDLEQASLMSVEAITSSETMRLLDDRTTLLEYFVTEKRIILWIVNENGMQTLELPMGRTALSRAVTDLRSAIASHEPIEQVKHLASALHDTLILPAKPYLRGDRLTFVPHGVLHYLPWGVLSDPDGKWLSETYSFATLPSASVLKYLGQKGRATGTQVIAIGNPDLGEALELRYAEREVRAVGATYPGALIFVRDAATEQRAKALAPEAAILHLAVHGKLDQGDPLSSALLLLPGGGEDGLLEVREVLGLSLRAKLVVLSACETALGGLSRGDELVGLQRAFLYAGTATVVTTLWAVDDRASYVLMGEFYPRLEAIGASGSLRAAQRAVMQELPHPFYWGAFVVTGRHE